MHVVRMLFGVLVHQMNVSLNVTSLITPVTPEVVSACGDAAIESACCKSHQDYKR